MTDLDELWSFAQGWEPPFSRTLRAVSIAPVVAFVLAVSISPLSWPSRVLVGLLCAVAVYVGFSFVLYLALTSGAPTFASVEVAVEHLGWFGERCTEIGDLIGIDRWHFGATTLGGDRTELAPGGAAVALMPDATAAIVLMCHEDRPSNRVDFRFVSAMADGMVTSTGNTPPLVPFARIEQSFDRGASAKELWISHKERLGAQYERTELKDVLSVIAPPGRHANPIVAAGFWRFAANWAVNSWRRRGTVAPLGS